MVQLIDVVDDLSWLAKTWRHEGEPAIPYAVEARLPDGRSARSLLLFSDEAVLLHRGGMALVQPTTDEIRALAQTLFAKPFCRLRELRLDSLRKWCDVATDDGPCLDCNGTGVRFGGNGSPRFCPHCSEGRLRKPIWGRIGSVLLNQRALVGVLSHLRGDAVSFGLFDDYAPMLWSNDWVLICNAVDEDDGVVPESAVAYG